MTIYHIRHTEKTKNYDECIFLETDCDIFVETPNMGFIKSQFKTSAELGEHLRRLKHEGFIIEEKTYTPQRGA